MPVIQVGDQVVQFPDDMSEDQILSAIQGMQPSPSRPSLAEEISTASQDAQAEIDASLSGTERFLIGAGSVFNDIGKGVQQLYSRAVGDEQAAKDIGEVLARERDIFAAFDDKQIGAEDLGEFAGEFAALLPTGGAGLSIRGGALMGGLLEGIKGTESGLLTENLANAGAGAAFGAAGGLLGKVAAGIKNKLSPAAASILDDVGVGLSSVGLKEAVSSGVLSFFGGARGMGGALVAGGLRLSKQARASDQAKRFLNQQIRRLQDSKQKQLLGQRQEQLDDLSAKAYEQMLELGERLSPENRRALISEEVNLTLMDLVEAAQVQTTDGRVGIDTAELLQSMPFMVREDLQKKLGPQMGAEFDALRTLWQAQAKTVLTPAQIAEQMQRYTETITDELLPIMTKSNLSVTEKKARKTLIDYIIGAGSQAAAQEQEPNASIEQILGT